MNTKKIIMDAALELFHKQSIDKISVQDIIDKAIVSRSTFYKYFYDKYDVITVYCEDATKEIVDSLSGHPWEEVYTAQNKFVYDNLPLFKVMFQKDTTGSLSRFMAKNNYQQIMDAYLAGSRAEAPTEEITIALTFTISGLEEIIRNWVLHGAPDDAFRFSEMSFNFIPEILRRYLV